MTKPVAFGPDALNLAAQANKRAKKTRDSSPSSTTQVALQTLSQYNTPPSTPSNSSKDSIPFGPDAGALALHSQGKIEEKPPVSPSSLTSSLKNFPIAAPAETPVLKSLSYLLCNEVQQLDVLHEVGTLDTFQETPRVHLGFSGWFNFDIIAQRKSDLAIICDFDSNMIAALNLVREAVLKSETREEFIDSLWKLLQESDSDFPGVLMDEAGVLDISAFEKKYLGRGWLHSESSFHHVKQMYLENRIIHRKLNIADKTSTFPEIQSWLDANHLQIDTIYSSNIPEWLHNSFGQLDQMYENLAQITNPNTALMTAQCKIKGFGQPELSLHRGRHPELRYQVRKKASRSRVTPDQSASSTLFF